MKRNERNNYNHIARDIRKNGIESIINIEVPTNYTHEARQACHELLTAYNLRAVCIYWNDIEKTWALHYEPARYTEAHDEKRRQEAEDVDTVTARMTRRNWTWNGYPAPADQAEAEPAQQPAEAPAAEAEQQPTETENAPQAAAQAAEGTTQQAIHEYLTINAAMNAAEQIMSATRRAMAEWRDNHPGEEYDDMCARLEYINQRVIELTTEADREAAETYVSPAQQPTETENAPEAAEQAAEETTTDEKKEEDNTMSTTTKPTATPEAAAILAINPAIFKGLHIKLGFDFQQPVTICRIPAPFTIKKAWKLAGADHDPATSTAAIIMRDTSNTWGIYRDMHMAPITADNLRDDYDDHGMSYSLGRAHGYRTVFSSFYAKGCFHDLRKSPTCEAWIIAQCNDLLKPWKEPKRDWTERQMDMNPGEHEQRSRIYYSNRPRPAIIIDKSNYRVDLKRDDLKRRAAKLRADRQKAAADAATIATAASRYNDLLKAFSAAKQRIITALVNVDPLTLGPAAVTELETIGKAVSEYAWEGLSGAARDINEFAAATRENKFTTPARYDAAYNAIIDKLAAILPEDASTAKEAV